MSEREIMLAVGDEGTSSKVSNKHEMASEAPAGAFALFAQPRRALIPMVELREQHQWEPLRGGKPGQALEGLRSHALSPESRITRRIGAEQEAAEYYKVNGSAKFFDPRAEKNANASTPVSENLDEEYDACLSLPYVT